MASKIHTMANCCIHAKSAAVCCIGLTGEFEIHHIVQISPTLTGLIFPITRFEPRFIKSNKFQQLLLLVQSLERFI